MTEFNAKMQQLRAEYRSVVAGDLGQLQQQAAGLQGDECDRATLELIVATLHRIAGGAGVFGFGLLSEQAHGLELDLNDALAAPLAEAYRAEFPELRAGLLALTLPPEAGN